MARVLYVSKPVTPPWNDSSKNLVRDLSSHLERHVPVVMGRSGAGSGGAWSPPGGETEAVYLPQGGGFAPGLRDNARVLGRLLTGPASDLWHFFFAPNPRTSSAGRWAARLRGMPTVQTVCSAPRADGDPVRLLFADRTVVLSRHTEKRLLDAGVAAERLRRIPPSVPELRPPSEAERRRTRAELGLPQDGGVVVYPGDLEFGGGAERMLAALVRGPLEHVVLVMACRAKTPASREVAADLQAHARAAGVADRVHWVGETSRIHDLLAAADVVALPSDDLYAKMDHPLVLLEAMALERPVIVARSTPAEELASGDAAVAVPADVGAVGAALASLMGDPHRRAVLGSNAAARVRERHSPSAMAASYERLYDELV